METLLMVFSEYYLKFDWKNKILYIGKPIKVIDFMRIRKYIEKFNLQVEDIRLEAKGKYYY